jgi:hypothetical protein
MPLFGIRVIAVGLAVCLLVLSGLMYPQTVAHAAHHAHHKAATHSTALCTWMCAAGQAQETVSFNFEIETNPLRLIESFIAPPLIEVHFAALATRGPPSHQS